jgi:ABC-type glycerol-3-phosphate transport system permease component
MAAYALSKFNFPGKNTMFQLIVLSLMFSGSVTGIPSFLIIAKLGLIDTPWSIIVPAISGTLGLYLMKQFMDQQIHNSLLEAARIDGASELRIFYNIVMPLVKPGWLTLMILTVQSLWNATGGGYIFSEEWKMLPTALSQITATGIARSGVAAAITVVMMIVPIGTFVLSQSQMIETMATSGMKD